MVKEQNPRTFILRVAWLYGPRGKNFVKTMLKLAREREEIRVVDDQRGTPTFAGDVARQIKALIKTDCYGLYHCTSQGSCTWYEFAKEIFKRAGYRAESNPDGSVRLIPNTQDLRPITLRPVTSAEFPRPAKRPTNSVLENFMLKVQGLDIMPHWEEPLAAQIQRIKEAIEE
jgi:dTDP-4-dehydrorhamnose reductase